MFIRGWINLIVDNNWKFEQAVFWTWRTKMQIKNYKELDFEILPKEARKELLDFYEFLVDKYKKH